MNVFTLSVIVSAVLAVLKLTVVPTLGWLAVAAPVLISLSIGVLFLFVTGIIALVALARRGR